MNKYEKAAIFFFRIVGVSLAAIGMMALLYLAGFLVAGNKEQHHTEWTSGG